MQKKTFLLIITIILIISTISYIELSKPKLLNINNNNSLPTPELQGISGYINTPNNTQLSDFQDKIILVDFWTYSCINCIRTIPHLVAWNAKYKDKGLVIIGVHTPEFEFEKNYQNVLEATNKFNITYPVVQDNDYKTWNAFGNQYWPRKYLIDTKGVIRYDHIGEGGYEETEKQIQELLAEIGQNISGMTDISDNTPQFQTTQELYAGYEFMLPRGQDLGNSNGLQSEKEYLYTIEPAIRKDKIYLIGNWKSNRDNLQTISNEQHQIILNYTAQDINIVADSLNLSLIHI
jgi:thiol-disulfide isomerase/thioredoxin